MAGVELLLEGKAALITGGSRGIGAETVRLFRAAGARVAFSYREAGERAEALAKECGGPMGMGQRPEKQGPGDPRNQSPTAAAGLGGISVGASAATRGRGAGLEPGAGLERPRDLGPGWSGRAIWGSGLRSVGSAELRGNSLRTNGDGDAMAVTGAGGAPSSAAADGSNSVQCVGIRQELESAADGRRLVEKAVAALGRLDILVVNHGIWPEEDAPITAMSDEQWRRTMGVNLDAVFGLVQAGAAQFERQRSVAGEKGSDAAGHIVLISSTAGQRGEAFHADYAASKGALISLTKSLSSELAPKGIRVNCVAPGWVETDMSAGTLADPEQGPRVRAAIPVGRVATPREIAGPVLFLCTPLAGFISGEVLNVNGGAVLVG